MNITEQNKITAYIKEVNVRLHKLNAEDPNPMTFIFDLSPEAVLKSIKICEPSIETFEEYIQYQAWESYYEMYKDVNGVRPTWTCWKDGPATYWDLQYSSLLSESEYQYA
jgi:prephenate dehydrogenase